MTAPIAFQARELLGRGFGLDRVAVLLDVTLDELDVALGKTAEPDVSDDPVPGEPILARSGATEVAVRCVDVGAAWPPPADESSEWGTVQVARLDMFRERLSGSVEVRVRWVWLAAEVRAAVDDRGRVFCDDCAELKTVEELRRPSNACPVGRWLRAEPFDTRRSGAAIDASGA